MKLAPSFSATAATIALSIAAPASADAELTLTNQALEFIPWYASPTRRPLLIVGNEISGTTTVYQIDRN